MDKVLAKIDIRFAHVKDKIATMKWVIIVADRLLVLY